MKQKARDNWLELGDRNTAYFHSVATISKRRTQIRDLKNSDDLIVSDKESLKNLAKNFFSQLYFDNSSNTPLHTNTVFPMILQAFWRS